MFIHLDASVHLYDGFPLGQMIMLKNMLRFTKKRPLKSKTTSVFQPKLLSDNGKSDGTMRPTRVDLLT